MSQIPRLFIGDRMVEKNQMLHLDESQSHYLIRVLRLQNDAQVKLLGAAGEWLARITEAHKKNTILQVSRQLRQFTPTPDIWLCFAPVKHDKIDVLAKRAVELGAAALWPISTDYTQHARLNEARLTQNLIQSAEQCSRLDIPVLKDYCPLTAMLDQWDGARILLHADESGDDKPLHLCAKDLKKGSKAAILIGPEGGFSQSERQLLASKPFVKSVTLGPRVLRSETAALVGLAHLQAWIGDGDEPPHYTIEEQ